VLYGLIAVCVAVTVAAFSFKRALFSGFTVIAIFYVVVKLRINVEKLAEYKAALARYEKRRRALIAKLAPKNGDWQ